MSAKTFVPPKPNNNTQVAPSEYPEAVSATSMSGLEDAPINILIVDDEPNNLTVLEALLTDRSYRLVRATSAEEALLALIVDEFALLILDINMPDMTGFELAQMIKTRKRNAHVPIIFLTAYYNEDQHVLEGYGTGAVDYLYKPVNPAALRSKVSVFAELHRKNRECGTANLSLRAEVANRRRIEEQLRNLNETLEQRVTERTEALRENETRLRHANQALEHFAFAASHDLREPLRKVAIYSELFQKRYGANLNEEATMYLGNIVEGAQRTGRLLSDLLEYTQVAGRDGQAATIVDGEKVLDRVLRNLDHAVQESHARITHDTLPSVLIRDVHLEQLLQNLIGNAIKYKNDDETPQVHVSALQQDGRCHFVVQDNGIGIAPEDHESVFGVFKRLHPTGEKYSGTGIGLAICQKIAENYGGRIWVESELGHGATFHFTVPAVEPEEQRAGAQPICSSATPHQ